MEAVIPLLPYLIIFATQFSLQMMRLSMLRHILHASTRLQLSWCTLATCINASCCDSSCRAQEEEIAQAALTCTT